MKIGIDVGGTNLVAGLVNEQGEILCKVPQDQLVDKLMEEIERL